jgi:transcriptional regulator with XRE-family HTH domain
MLNRYDGYAVGPKLRQLRKDRKLSVYQVSEMTGLSNSSINQMEQGGRNLSMNSLYLFMDVYKCDANTILDINNIEKTDKKTESIDEMLTNLPEEKQAYLKQTFKFMIEQSSQIAS